MIIEENNFSEIYEKYVKKIYNFIYYKTHHKETAEDLTSQTFIKALEHFQDLKLETNNISAWLYKIATNTVIDHYRTKRNIEHKDIADVWDLSTNENIPKDLDTKLKLESVQEYLKKIKAEHRDIVLLRVWEGLSYKEIAKIAGKTETNCKMIFARAMMKLKEQMTLATVLILRLFL
jgi:RNA polymerase sigma-70 factor (ECF subfamily)